MVETPLQDDVQRLTQLRFLQKHTGRKKNILLEYGETIKERASEERKNIRGFTSSWRLGRMTLKCTRTDRKVQLLVFVFSWSWTENIKEAAQQLNCFIQSTAFSNRQVSRAGAHHAETGPEAVHMLRVADQDQNHHPLDQVLDGGLVTAEPSFKHTAHQRGDEPLHAHAQKNTHSCSPGVYLLCETWRDFLTSLSLGSSSSSVCHTLFLTRCCRELL